MANGYGYGSICTIARIVVVLSFVSRFLSVPPHVCTICTVWLKFFLFHQVSRAESEVLGSPRDLALCKQAKHITQRREIKSTASLEHF